MPKKNTKTPPKQGRKKRSLAEEEATIEGSLDALIPASVKRPTVDLLAPGDSTLETSRELCNMLLAARKNRPTGFSRLEDIRKNFVTLPHFMQRYLFGIYGIPHGVALEIIGAEHLGKTTLGLTFMGAGIDLSGGAGLWLETENKPLVWTHVMRIFNSDPQRALTMVRQGMEFANPHTLQEMVEKMEDWVAVMRGRKSRAGRSVCLPLHQPLIVLVDTISKLMPEGEAIGHYLYGKLMDPKVMEKKKDLATGSNFEFSKFVHAWARRLPSFLSQNNVVLILNSHQNDEVDMGGGGMKSFAPENYLALFNTKKIGGRATNQNTAFQIIIGQDGTLKDANGAVIGQKIRARMHKNTFAPHGRIIKYELHNIYTNDVPGKYWEPVLQFDRPMLEWLMNENLLDVTQVGENWSCPSLNIYNASAMSVVNAFSANAELVAALANKLRIEGYWDPVAAVLEESKKLEQAAS